MRNSSILKWANNKNSGNDNTGESNNKKNSKKEEKEKKWIHQPETLVSGHVVYLVKFLGSIDVDQPKGIEVVKQGIQKLKFNQQLKKQETGENPNKKPPKVELTISVDGVTIQEPKTKNLLHRYPLHQISYCADDKAEKRFFSFIAREEKKEDGHTDHTCFVFVSDKLAEEITLTIGQAFELAYKKFLDTSGREKEAKQQALTLQKRVQMLEEENKVLRQRLRDVASIKGMADVQNYMRQQEITEITEVKSKQPTTNGVSKSNSISSTNGEMASNKTETPQQQPKPKSAADELICLDADTGVADFTLDDLNDDDFNPRGEEQQQQQQQQQQEAPTLLQPPPPTALSQQKQNLIFHKSASENIFAPKTNPFGGSDDPFGMSVFDAGNGNSKPGHPFADGFGTAAPKVDAGGLFADLDPLKK